MRHNKAVMVLKNDDRSGEVCRTIDASQDSACEGDGSPPAKNGVGLQHSDIQPSSHLGIKPSKISLEEVECRTEASYTCKSFASEDTEISLKSTSHLTSVENQLLSSSALVSHQRRDQKLLGWDDDSSSIDRRANDAAETVCCSDRDASCGPGTTNEAIQEVEAVDCVAISASPMIPNYIKDRHFDFKKHSQFLEAASHKLSSPSEKCQDNDQDIIKSNKPTQSDELQTLPEDDVDESDDIEEEDVKVCDICGDAGREDLLAVCSRCSDGAEHTYCMRDMLDKVPEGDWLCEECKCNEFLEARKQESSKKLGSKCLGWTSSLHSDLSLKLDDRDPFCEQGKPKNGSLNKQAPSKRPGVRIEAGPTAKKQALESSMGSPTTSGPSRIPTLSKDSSSKNMVKMMGKPSNLVSAGTESTGDSSENARSPTNSFHTSKGNFVKSNSFSTCNSKPNVKISEDIFQNQKQGVDLKDGPGKLIGKSMSFKGLGRSNVNEPKVKMLSPKCAPVQDIKSQKQGRDRSSFERKNMIKVDHSFLGQMAVNSSKRLSRATDSIPSSFVSSSLDYKNTQSDEKLSNMSKHAGHSALKSPDATANLGEVKRLSSANIVGSTPVNGTSTTAEAKLNHASIKDGSTLHSSWTADRLLSADGARVDVHDTHREKSAENSFGRSRVVPNGGVLNGNRRGIVLDASASRSKEGLNEENKLKAAIEAAMQKKQDMFKKNKIPERPYEDSMSNTQGNHGGDAFSNQARDSISEAAGHAGDIGSDNISSSCKQIAFSSAKQFKVHPADFVISPVGESVLAVSAIPEQESVWQGGFEIHRNGKLPDICGGFQAHLSSFASDKVFQVAKKFPQKIVLNEVPRPCAWPVQFKEIGAREDNIALYFFAKDIESYVRSYKILLEYLMKHDLALRGQINGVELLVFPSNHLPHTSQCWNTLFFMWGVFRGRRSRSGDDRSDSLVRPEFPPSNMALLDKNVASGGLSENPLHGPAEEDLSVSGSGHAVSGFESPVLTGSYLQQTCSLSNGDCHNEKYSVVGTCLSSPGGPENHEKRPQNHYPGVGEACPESGSAAPKDYCLQDPTTIIRHQKLTRVIDRGDNLHESRNSPPELMLDTQHISSLSSKPPLLSKQEGGRVVSSEDPLVLNTASNSIVDLRTENRLKLEKQCVDDKIIIGGQVKPENDVEEKEDMDYMLNSDTCKLKSEGSLRQEGYVDINVSAEGNTEDLHRLQYFSKRHSSEDSMKSISPDASMITCQKRPWVDGQDIPKDGDQSYTNKRVKGDLYGHPSFGDRLAIQMHGVSTSSQKEDTSKDADDEKSTSTKPGSSEGCFYLVNSYPAQNVQSGDSFLPFKGALSENEDRLPDGSPNLELALGVKKKQSREGVLPFFAGVVDRKDPERPPDIASSKEHDDEGSGSLSLSLAFPFPGKERPARPEKPPAAVEESHPARREVNTSLLLFRGSSGK